MEREWEYRGWVGTGHHSYSVSQADLASVRRKFLALVNTKGAVRLPIKHCNLKASTLSD